MELDIKKTIGTDIHSQTIHDIVICLTEEEEEKEVGKFG